MFLINKMFQLRDKANPEAEKPFLEHLEDLRVTVTKIVVTLLITSAICFAWNDELMAILRKPISDVWVSYSENKLPKGSGLDATKWERAKSIADASAQLNPEERNNYLTRWSSEDQKNAHIAGYCRAAKTFPAQQQKDFIASITTLNEADKNILTKLIELKADTTTGLSERFRFMSSLQPSEAFMLSMKLSLFAGIVLAFPLLLLFTMQFIMPGLHGNEKRAIYPALALGFGLFLCGVLFSYYYVLPKTLEFFYTYGENMGIINEWRIGYYLSFATQFTLLFGLCFELPVVVWVLVKVGLLNYEIMSRTRSYAIVAIVIIAAIITPTADAFTLSLLAVPMILLYELSIWLAWWHARKGIEAE